MNILASNKQTLTTRIIVLSISTFIFIVSFVLNITSNEALYNANLNLIPILQNNNVLGSHAFMVFMNVISMVFDPMICAAYIFVIYLISYRKLEIISFLIWFFFLSWILGIMKILIHQARPFWVPGSSVKMESWTCYTDYGCPSGHSMLAIVLLEFMLRFYARVHKSCHNYIWIGYVVIFTLEFLVMFSRVMLGMHSLNEVLFGLSIGVYSFVPYYLFVEHQIMKLILLVFTHRKSVLTNLLVFGIAAIFMIIEVTVTIVPSYDNKEYFNVIKNTKGCEHVKEYSSFEYNGLIGTSIAMAGFGTIFGMNYLKNPSNLIKILHYSRISVKFFAKFLLTIAITAIPLIVFMNPLWQRIQADTIGKAMISWGCQNIAFFLATFIIICIIPIIAEKLSMEEYKHPSSYKEFKQFESINMEPDIDVFIEKVRETELTYPKSSNFGFKENL